MYGFFQALQNPIVNTGTNLGPCGDVSSSCSRWCVMWVPSCQSGMSTFMAEHMILGICRVWVGISVT